MTWVISGILDLAYKKRKKQGRRPAMILTDFERSVEEWVREAPETLLILEKLHEDYDQVRDQPLELVCQRKGVDPYAVSVLVRGYRDNGRLLDETVLESFDIPELVGYILFN